MVVHLRKLLLLILLGPIGTQAGNLSGSEGFQHQAVCAELVATLAGGTTKIESKHIFSIGTMDHDPLGLYFVVLDPDHNRDLIFDPAKDSWRYRIAAENPEKWMELLKAEEQKARGDVAAYEAFLSLHPEFFAVGLLAGEPRLSEILRAGPEGYIDTSTPREPTRIQQVQGFRDISPGARLLNIPQVGAAFVRAQFQARAPIVSAVHIQNTSTWGVVASDKEARLYFHEPKGRTITMELPTRKAGSTVVRNSDLRILANVSENPQNNILLVSYTENFTNTLFRPDQIGYRGQIPRLAFVRLSTKPSTEMAFEILKVVDGAGIDKIALPPKNQTENDRLGTWEIPYLSLSDINPPVVVLPNDDILAVLRKSEQGGGTRLAILRPSSQELIPVNGKPIVEVRDRVMENGVPFAHEEAMLVQRFSKYVSPNKSRQQDAKFRFQLEVGSQHEKRLLVLNGDENSYTYELYAPKDGNGPGWVPMKPESLEP